MNSKCKIDKVKNLNLKELKGGYIIRRGLNINISEEIVIAPVFNP